MPAPTEVTNVVIEKGMSFSLQFDISNDDGTDYSLSGFTTASATIRKHAKSTIKEDFHHLFYCCWCDYYFFRYNSDW